MRGPCHEQPVFPPGLVSFKIALDISLAPGIFSCILIFTSLTLHGNPQRYDCPQDYIQIPKSGPPGPPRHNLHPVGFSADALASMGPRPPETFAVPVEDQLQPLPEGLPQGCLESFLKPSASALTEHCVNRPFLAFKMIYNL